MVQRPGLGDHGSNAPFSVFSPIFIVVFFLVSSSLFFLSPILRENFFLPSQANEGNLFCDDFNFQSMTVIKGSSYKLGPNWSPNGPFANLWRSLKTLQKFRQNFSQIKWFLVVCVPLAHSKWAVSRSVEMKNSHRNYY